MHDAELADGTALDIDAHHKSHESQLMQLADLFSGSVGRVLNREGDGMNHKDQFAAFFETVAGFDFKTEVKGKTDFVYVHRLA